MTAERASPGAEIDSHAASAPPPSSQATRSWRMRAWVAVVVVCVARAVADEPADAVARGEPAAPHPAAQSAPAQNGGAPAGAEPGQPADFPDATPAEAAPPGTPATGDAAPPGTPAESTSPDATPADSTPPDAMPAEPTPPPPPPATRIITLSPDLAELVYRAGAGQSLVGTIDHSDYPPEAQSVPRVGDAFGLDFERIRALRPDLVLAWTGGTPLRWIERLEDMDLRVVSLGVRRLEDVADEVEEIGRLTGRSDVARAAADEYRRSLASLRARYAGADPITVFFQIASQPLYTVGGRHAITAMIELCGGRNIFEDLSALAADVSAEAVLGRDPRVIIASDDEGEVGLEMWKRWPSLTAVANGDLYLVHADLVTRSSTRLVAGTGEICDALQRARAHRGAPEASADDARP
jgi:iron complex transport system substrate-binding protein